MLTGLGVLEFSYSQRNTQFEPIPAEELNARLSEDDNLEQYQKNIIISYMSHYLTRDSLQTIINTAIECKKNSRELLIYGIPIAGENGGVSGLIPKEVVSGLTEPVNRGNGGTGLRFNSLGYQLVNVSAVGQKNTLSNIGFTQSSDPVLLPYFKMNRDMSIERINIQESNASHELMTNDKFQEFLINEFKEKGSCAFVSVTDADKRLTSTNHILSFTQKDGSSYFIDACEDRVKSAPSVNEISLAGAPQEVQQEFKNRFNTTLPMVANKENRIILSDPTIPTITLYDPANLMGSITTSEIVGYQQKDLAASEQLPLTPGIIGGYLTAVTGLIFFVKGVVRYGKDLIHNHKSIKSSTREVRPKPVTKDKILAENEIARNERFIPATLEIRSGDRNRLINLTEDEVGKYLIEQFGDKAKPLQDRLWSSRKEIMDLFSTINLFNGDFSDIRKVIDERKRFSEIEIGGDSAIVGYEISTGQNKTKEIIGYLLIDANLEDNFIEVELWSEKPDFLTLNKQKARKAIESIVSHESKDYTVEQISIHLADEISILIGNSRLSEEEFNSTYNYCRGFYQSFKNNSLIKKETIRLLAERIRNNQIQIFEGKDVKPKGSYVKYAPTIAAKIFGYTTGEFATNSEEFDAFTGEAKRLLTNSVIPQTAIKFWGKRTESRIQIIQTQNKEKERNIAVIFTHHDH